MIFAQYDAAHKAMFDRCSVPAGELAEMRALPLARHHTEASQ
jgi:hypothetical protein